MLPVTILSGLLGAGIATLLNHTLSERARFAVIVGNVPAPFPAWGTGPS